MHNLLLEYFYNEIPYHENNASFISLLGDNPCIGFPERGVKRVYSVQPRYACAAEEFAVAAPPRKVCLLPRSQIVCEMERQAFYC